MTAAAWLMTTLGGGPELVALVQAAVTLPIALLSLPAGALADVVGRRRVVLASQALTILVSVALAVAAWRGALAPWSLLAFTLAIGAGKALNNPAWQTAVSEIVPRPDLPPAIALNALGFNLARSVGPAIGGALVAALGAFAAFALNAALNLGAVALAWRWPRGDRPALPPEPLGGAMAAGVRYVALSPVLVRAMGRGAFYNLAAVALLALMPLVARDLVGGGARTFGVLLGAFGLGAVGAALVGPRLRRRLSIEGVVRAGFALSAAGTLAVAWAPSPAAVLAATAVAGMSWLLAMSSFNTVVQTSSPRWVLSRVHAIYQAVAFGANAAGSVAWGLLAGGQGVSAALAASAAVLALGAALGLVRPLRELDPAGLDPDAPWVAPSLAVDMVPTSGPIRTTVAYRVRVADIAAFHAAMTRRRRHRIRDGARRWSLSRDLQDPELWFESYQTATWIEVRRHHARRTVAGARVAEELRALHRGPDAPEVHYALIRHPEIPAEWAAWEGHP